MVEIGTPAPGFSLPTNGGGQVDSEALRGRPYLLYFYPKADTSGCTTQACGMQEVLPAFDSVSCTVIGVSPDAVKALDRFAGKFGLTFPLASDADHALAERYGCWVERSMYGRTYMGIERSSFLVGADGVVRAAWRKVKPAEHAGKVRDALATLG